MHTWRLPRFIAVGSPILIRFEDCYRVLVGKESMFDSIQVSFFVEILFELGLGISEGMFHPVGSSSFGVLP